MLQRLLIALAQIRLVNTSENLPSKTRQIIYFLYRAKDITKKVHKNIAETEWILYLWIVKIAKDMILINCYSIFPTKES